MSAHDQIRAMLDQLMGTSRNGEEEKITVKFDDPRVCKSFLLGCCPHEILASTAKRFCFIQSRNGHRNVIHSKCRIRMDLGECPKIHNLALRADYEKASKSKDYFYDLDALEQLSTFISDADRKTEQAKKRLAETQEELSTDVAVKADKVHELAEKIGESLAKAEQLGAEGFVDESINLMEEIENLRHQKSEAESEYRASIPAATYQQQKLRVCEVCCAYLGIHDNDRRLADHFGGKLHLGFIKIRDTLKEFQDTSEDRRRKRRDEYRHARNQDEAEAWGGRVTAGSKRDRESRDRDTRDHDRRDRDRRDRVRRDREDRHDSRSRDRDREKDRERSRSGRRHRSRSKSKDRKKSDDSKSKLLDQSDSKSRSRSHENDVKRKESRKKSKSRSRSRDRKRHSRS
ncbi:unnamed protein product [Allacma fusca]|uniref:RNA-binding protein Luc7-like 2 n=1 Tax=Allacma fusca TaxID=39272 RepID=A0A8J2PIB7_9HEXA|nr:unnamed protein product [Allacma fusca]